MQKTRRGILEYLRDRGTGTVESLAEAVGLAPVTVRHHLNVLRRRELVETDTESVGRGRPRHVFALSPTGAELLMDDGYQALAARLLDEMKRDGAQQAECFFRDLAAEIVDKHLTQLEGKPMEARLDTLSTMLSEQGFTMRWELENGGYLIHQVGCPYHSLSRDHSEVCLMDLELVKRATGGEVSRRAWRQTGDEACVLKVVEPAERPEAVPTD